MKKECEWEMTFHANGKDRKAGVAILKPDQIHIFFVLCIFRAIPAAYGGCQPRCLIRDAGAKLSQTVNNAVSYPCL